MGAPCYPNPASIEANIRDLTRRRELLARDEKFQRENNRRVTSTERGPVKD